MAVTFPVAGSFSAFATRFIDPAWGFASGWNYAMQWLFVMPLEIMAASITLEYWQTSIPGWASISIFLLIIITINLCGVKTYGEAEYGFSILKVTAVIGFIILGAVINVSEPQISILLELCIDEDCGLEKSVSGLGQRASSSSSPFLSTRNHAVSSNEADPPWNKSKVFSLLQRLGYRFLGHVQVTRKHIRIPRTF